MSEIEMIQIDSVEVKQEEVRKLALTVLRMCDDVNCFDNCLPRDRNEFYIELKERIESWVEELPWIAK